MAVSSVAYSSVPGAPKLRFDVRVFLCFVALTVLEGLIATIWSHHRWLRGFVGDVLAIAWVYLLLKSFVRASPLMLASAALLTGYILELAQYLAKMQGWHIQQPVLRVLIGSVPDWWDVVAYTIGFVLVLCAEKLLARLGVR